MMGFRHKKMTAQFSVTQNEITNFRLDQQADELRATTDI